MNADEALCYVRDHGAALESAKGPIPRLTELIAGEPIRGSWWAHPKCRQIFDVLQQLARSPDVLVCRLVDGHVTLVHRRLWPALVRMASHFDRKQLAQVHQLHTASGRHVSQYIEYPKWVPREVLDAARLLSEQQARGMLGPLAEPPRAGSRRVVRSSRPPAATRRR